MNVSAAPAQRTKSAQACTRDCLVARDSTRVVGYDSTLSLRARRSYSAQRLTPHAHYLRSSTHNTACDEERYKRCYDFYELVAKAVVLVLAGTL